MGRRPGVRGADCGGTGLGRLGRRPRFIPALCRSRQLHARRLFPDRVWIINGACLHLRVRVLSARQKVKPGLAVTCHPWPVWMTKPICYTKAWPLIGQSMVYFRLNDEDVLVVLITESTTVPAGLLFSLTKIFHVKWFLFYYSDLFLFRLVEKIQTKCRAHQGVMLWCPHYKNAT